MWLSSTNDDKLELRCWPCLFVAVYYPWVWASRITMSSWMTCDTGCALEPCRRRDCIAWGRAPAQVGFFQAEQHAELQSLDISSRTSRFTLATFRLTWLRLVSGQDGVDAVGSLVMLARWNAMSRLMRCYLWHWLQERLGETRRHTVGKSCSAGCRCFCGAGREHGVSSRNPAKEVKDVIWTLPWWNPEVFCDTVKLHFFSLRDSVIDEVEPCFAPDCDCQDCLWDAW